MMETSHPSFLLSFVKFIRPLSVNKRDLNMELKEMLTSIFESTHRSAETEQQRQEPSRGGRVGKEFFELHRL